jgi:hypothetical protein
MPEVNRLQQVVPLDDPIPPAYAASPAQQQAVNEMYRYAQWQITRDPSWLQGCREIGIT